MLSFVFGYWRQIAGVVLLAALCIGSNLQGRHSVHQEWELSEAKELAESRAATVAALMDNIALKEQWEQQREQAEQIQQQERAKNQVLVSSLSAGIGGLRSDITAYAAGPKADDSLAACRADAAALGQLLERALRVALRSTGGAEAHAADLRAVLAAWPVAEVMP